MAYNNSVNDMDVLTPSDSRGNFVAGSKRQRSSSLDLFDEISTLKVDEAIQEDWKIFNDPVHGSLRLHPVLVAIIDTPQFQRLRDVKQLGASYWIFPGACHNRFEHSIGTSHLCGKMLKTLKEQHTTLITPKDILCVEIAGLCHDLGHGPFSHVFDNQYVPTINPSSNWKHEQGSIDMFDYLIEQNPRVQRLFEEYNLGGKEIILIKDLILGKNPEQDTVQQTCHYNGSQTQSWFLFEIVSNKRNGIDCDKFDYMMRDCHYVGMKNNFDCMRYFQNTRIILVDNQLQVCVRDKEVFNLYEMFHMRWSLHHRVYQHKTTKIIEEMITMALSKVDKKFGISASRNDMSAFTLINDSIIYEILRCKDDEENVKEAQQILQKIQKRELYKFCGEVNVLLMTKNEDDLEGQFPSSQEVLKKGKYGIAEEITDRDDSLNAGDVLVNIVDISFGMKHHDPINSVVFYSKDGKPVKVRKDHISELLPRTFREKYIRVYSKDSSKKDIIKICFDDWCSKNGFSVPNLLDGDKTGYFTDVHKNSAMKETMSSDRMGNLGKNTHVKRSLGGQF